MKNALRLHESRGRKMQNRIIIFGRSEIRKVQLSKADVVEVFVCNELLTDETRELVDGFAGVSHAYDLPVELFNKLAFGQRPDGLVAVAKRPNTALESFKPSNNSLVVVIEAIEKPGNIGAVFRSAVAAGVDAIILADPVCDVFHPNSIRSSLGTVFSVPVYCAPSTPIKDLLAKNEFLLAATRVDAEKTYTEVDLTGHTAIIMGSESKGLSKAWGGASVTPVVIPMHGDVDSLNIAMTSTLMTFEARRQRDLK